MEPIQVLELVVSNLERLKIPYMVVGSFASSLYGPTRFTQDADFILSLNLDQVDAFLELFAKEFYVDRGLIERALKTRSSFNAIHFESSFKVDFFCLKNRGFDRQAFSRRQITQIHRSDLQAYVQTPDDTVVSKLDWYRQGGEVSESQWRDVIGVLKTQAGRLDLGYLRKWAAELGVADLLKRALEEAAGS